MAHKQLSVAFTFPDCSCRSSEAFPLPRAEPPLTNLIPSRGSGRALGQHLVSRQLQHQLECSPLAADRSETEHHVAFRKWSRRRNIRIATGVVVALLSTAAAVIAHPQRRTHPQVAFSDLLRDVDRGAVSEVVVNGDALRIVSS